MGQRASLSSGRAFCYRFIAQEMAKVVEKAFPQFARFLRFVDYDSHEVGPSQSRD